MGAKFCFHSQPHPDKTPLQTESRRRGLGAISGNSHGVPTSYPKLQLASPYEETLPNWLLPKLISTVVA